MKKLLFLLTCIYLSVQFKAQAQNNLTPAQWQSDLEYLQNKIHTDYRNLFHHITPASFDSAVNVLKKDIPHLNEAQIRVGFIRLMAMFKIGHTRVGFETVDSGGNLTPMFHFFPITISPFSDGLFIQSIDSTYKEAVGGKLIKIGDSPVEVALNKMRSVIPCENEQHFRSQLHYYFRFPEILEALNITPSTNAVELTYHKAGNQKKIIITARDCPGYEWNDGIFLPKGWVDAYENFNKPASVLWLKEPRKIRYFEYLKESKTIYVRHIAVVEREDEVIDEFFEKVFLFADSVGANKFVLDIRMNNGGNNYLNKPVITSIIKSKTINRYGHFFVIIGAATFSAAQNLTNELEKYTEAIFVGEPTGENVNFWGDSKTEVLPLSKLNIHMSWLWWQNMDPRDKRQWTSPNLAAEISFENYTAGYDSSMSIIMGYKEEKRIEEKIKNHIAAGKNEAAITAINQYLENPLHRYCKNELEEKISDLGFLTAMRGNLEGASHYFYITAKTFPHSFQAYNNYGDCLYYMGKNDEALINYEKAFALTKSDDDKKSLLEKIGALRK